MFWSEWVVDGLLTAVGVCGSAVPLRMGCKRVVLAASGGGQLVESLCLCLLSFTIIFCHDLSVAVRDISPQPGGRRGTQCMLFLT